MSDKECNVNMGCASSPTRGRSARPKASPMPQPTQIAELSKLITVYLLNNNVETSIFLSPYLFIKLIPTLKIEHHVGYIALGRNVVVPHCWMTYEDKIIDPTVPYFENITRHTPKYLYDPLSASDHKTYLSSVTLLDYDTYETTFYYWNALLDSEFMEKKLSDYGFTAATPMQILESSLVRSVMLIAKYHSAAPGHASALRASR